MRKFIFLLVPLFMACVVFGGTSVTLEGLSRPAILIIKFDRLYVLEKTTVYIYSLQDFKLIKKFGKAGEGPREFKTSPMGPPMTMSFHNTKMVINSMNKLSFFTNEGEFLREIKNPIDGLFFLIKDKYLVIGPVPYKNNSRVIGFRLFGSDFKSQKIIYQSDFAIDNPRELLVPITTFTYNPVYKGKIYIASSSTDFIIDVYRADGSNEYSIKKEYKKIPISDAYKRATHTWFKNDPRFKPMYESMIKKMLTFRDYFQPIRDIQVADDTIHVITYKRKNDRWECILLDLKGNEKKRVFIPLEAYVPFSFYPILYSVYKGNMYTLVEDEDEEVWKVHFTPLK